MHISVCLSISPFLFQLSVTTQFISPLFDYYQATKPGKVMGSDKLINIYTSTTCLAAIGFFKISNEDTRTICENCSKLPIKTVERHHWRRYDAHIVDLSRFHTLVCPFHL